MRASSPHFLLVAVAMLLLSNACASSPTPPLSSPDVPPIATSRPAVQAVQPEPPPVDPPTAIPAVPAALLPAVTLSPPARVLPGLEILLRDRLDLVRGKRVALLTNQTGVDGLGRSGVDLLRAAPGVTLVAIFSPEHGWRGTREAGERVDHGHDSATGLPVYSLYGDSRRPSQTQLRGVDVLVVDLQDLGLRFYTYVATLAEVLRAAAQHGVPVVVLDRPAPLTGERVEGNVLDPLFASFVGPFPIPSRYGLTLGEMAGLMNEHFSLGADLVVVPMEGWKRASWYDQTGLAWLPPSPNLPTLDAATAYPGTVFFEGTNLSEGRGTPRPFQFIGAPWIDGERWSAALNALDLPGVRFEAVQFTPERSKHAGERCFGVEVQVVDRDSFEPIRTALHMLATVRDQHPRSFAFDADLFDLLAGTDETRRKLEAGMPVEEIIAPWEQERQRFEAVRQRYLLYR